MITLRNVMSKYQMLWRMLFTVVLLICIPILLVNWITLRNIYKETETQNRKFQVDSIARFASYFASQQNEMYEIIYDMRSDTVMLPDSIDSHPYNVIETIEKVNYYNKSLPISENIFVYYRDLDCIVGKMSKSRRIFFANKFASNYLELDEKLTELFDGDFSGIEYISISSPRNSNSGGVLVCIQTTIKKYHDAVVLFHINGNSLTETFFGHTDEKNSEIFIFKDEELLVSNANYIPGITESDEFKSFLNEKETVNRDIEFEGNEYCFSKIYDDSNGLTFVIAAPMEVITESVGGIADVITNMMLLSLVIIIMLAAATIYINYKPIRAAVKKITPEDNDIKGAGEISTIMNALDDAITQKEVMSMTITEQEIMVKDLIVQRLLSGKNVAERDRVVLGISEEQNSFFVITIFTQIGSISFEDIEEQLIVSLTEGYPCKVFVTQAFFEGQLVFVFAADNSAAEEQIQEKIAVEVLSFIQDNTQDQNVKLGVGSVERKIEDIRSSYLSSVIAADQGEHGEVSFYEQAVQNFNTFENYPSEKVLIFMQYIKQGELSFALRALDEIFEHISKYIASWMSERFVYYDVVNMFVKTVSKLGCPVSNTELGKMMSFSDVSELKKTMMEMTVKTCGNVQQEKQLTDQQMLEVITEYVNENYLNKDISLNMAADHFGMSIYTFSSLFKRIVGIGFREYVVKKRLEHAKELILKTDMTVKGIASLVGFGDVSYFIRVFKNNYNETPTQLKARGKKD